MDKYDELCERLMGMPSVMAMRDAAAAIRELKARLEIDPRHSIDGIAARDATIRMLEGRVAELETELLGVKEYREKNPLGGPAKVFDAMADQIRAGEDFNKVIADYGWCPVSRAERAEAELAEAERRGREQGMREAAEVAKRGDITGWAMGGEIRDAFADAILAAIAPERKRRMAELWLHVSGQKLWKYEDDGWKFQSLGWRKVAGPIEIDD